MITIAAEIAVVGAGPAGMSAAVACAERGASVVMLDENAESGGQIWRGMRDAPASVWRARTVSAGVRVEAGVSVVHGEVGGGVSLWGVRDGGTVRVNASRLILATGARELMLPFNGWTTPGVMGIGGLQAMIKSGLDVRDRRVVLLGSGPLMHPVAALARERGAQVVAMVEQASLARQMRVLGALSRVPTKMIQAIELMQALRGVPRYSGWWPVRVVAERGRVAGLEITNGVKRESFECEMIGASFGLVPNVRLADAIGCERSGGAMKTDAFQRTSVDGVWCAGESAGIGGVDVAVLEGEIAGCAAVGADIDRQLLRGRDRARAFVAALDRAYALRPELRAMAGGDEILCRCEDASVAQVRVCESWRDAKLQCRCGMGECQGRTCGSIAAYLFGWEVRDRRAPTAPVRVRELMQIMSEDPFAESGQGEVR